jgi:predicted RNase H-like HicB family nuclease
MKMRLRKPISAEGIAKLASQGHDVSRFFTNNGNMAYPSRTPNRLPRFDNLTVRLYREQDGRWLSDLPALPGVTAYAKTRRQAIVAAQALALRHIADLVERGHPLHGEIRVSFVGKQPTVRPRRNVATTRAIPRTKSLA